MNSLNSKFFFKDYIYKNINCEIQKTEKQSSDESVKKHTSYRERNSLDMHIRHSKNEKLKMIAKNDE